MQPVSLDLFDGGTGAGLQFIGKEKDLFREFRNQRFRAVVFFEDIVVPAQEIRIARRKFSRFAANSPGRSALE